MKHIIKLIIILSLFVQVCHAQKIETEEEYKVVYDSLVSRLKLAEKDTSSCTGKPFSELVKLLDKYGMKIIRVNVTNYDRYKLYPQHAFGITLSFLTWEDIGFMRIHKLMEPEIIIEFNESKPYEKALSLEQKYTGGRFEEEVEAFYSDAVIKSIGFYSMDNMYAPWYKQKQEE